MATLVLFHHVQGLTVGVQDFADELRAAGHVVHTPDLFEGRTFTKLAGGMEYAKSIGFEAVIERGVRAAQSLPSDVVYGGFSMGVMPAEKLLLTREGARGGLFLHSAIPPSEFGGSWPQGVPLQIHTMEQDEMGDVDVAKELVKEVEGAELFLYPGSTHLFTDNSLPDYDEDSASLALRRARTFLDRIDSLLKAK